MANYSDIISQSDRATSLISIGSNAADVLNFIYATPVGYQPQPNVGQSKPESFVFHYEGEQTISLESDITDHYVEDNSSLQDHIALSPVTVSTRGFVGELNDITPSVLVPLKAAAQKLGQISAYTPALSVTALEKYNQALLAYETAASLLSTAKASFTQIFGGQSLNQQQIYFRRFYDYWRSRTLFTVQTPWQSFPNMAIQSLRTLQDPDTDKISSFEITFKQIRFAQTIVAIQNSQGRASAQSSPLIENGSSKPTIAENLTDKLKSAFKGSFTGVA